MTLMRDLIVAEGLFELTDVTAQLHQDRLR